MQRGVVILMFLNDRSLIGLSLVVLLCVFFFFFYLVCKCHYIVSCIDLFTHVCCLNFNKVSVGPISNQLPGFEHPCLLWSMSAGLATTTVLRRCSAPAG